jgi:hypothetical protein
MGILANLMPGVRAIRAPLAAGFLLLLSVWIALESEVPKRPTDGVWASLERLEPVASAFGTVGLIAFVAYVVGSLYLVAVTNLPWGRRDLDVDRMLNRLDRVVDDVRTAEPKWPNPESEATETWSRTRDMIKDSYSPPFDADSRRRLEQFVESHLGPLAHPDDVRRLSQLLPDNAYVRQQVLIQWTLGRIFLEQWETLPLTLVGTQPHLYEEVDRFKAEADFRLALQGPLPLLALVVGASGGNLLAGVVGLLVGILVAWMLRFARRDSQRRANAVLANGVTSKLVALRTSEAEVHPATPAPSTADSQGGQGPAPASAD